MWWTSQDKSLIRIKFLQARRRLKRLNLDSLVKGMAFFLLLALFWSSCFLLVSRLYSQAFSMEVIGPLLLKRFLSIGFSATFIIICGSHVLSAYAALFRSHELPMLIASPYPVPRMYRILSLETLINGGWVLGLFCLPFLIAYGFELSVRWWYYPIILVGLAGFISIAGCIGILIMLFIARWLMSRPLRTTIGIVLFFGTFIGLFLFGAIINLELTSEVSASRVGEKLANMRASSYPYLPSLWMSELMSSAQVGDRYRTFIYLLLLSSTAVMLWHLVLELGERWYSEAWLWAQERVGLFQYRREAHQFHVRRLWIMRLLPRRFGSIVYKEIYLFARDFSQWGQLVLILALIVFYIAHTQNVIYGDTVLHVRNGLAFFNVVLLGFVQATLALRYTYPSVSSEGRAFWVVASAEQGIERSYFTKFYLHALILMGIGLGIGSILNQILNVDPTLNRVSMFVLFLFSLGFTGCTLGFGAVFHKFEATSIAEVTSDTGTLVAMILTLMYFGISVAFLARFALDHTPGTELTELFAIQQDNGMIAYCTAFLFIQTCCILFPTAYGLKKLKEDII